MTLEILVASQPSEPRPFVEAWDGATLIATARWQLLGVEVVLWPHDATITVSLEDLERFADRARRLFAPPDSADM